MYWLFLTLVTVLPAQTVSNTSAYSYAGWKRVPTDWLAPSYMGWSSDMMTMYVVAEDAVDVWASVAAGQTRQLNLGLLQPWTRPLSQWSDINQLYLGLPTINGQPMELSNAHPSGAGWLLKFRCLFDGYYHAGFSCVWYPSQPQIVHGEAVVAVFSPSVSNTAPSVQLSWGDSYSSQPIIVPQGTIITTYEPIKVQLTFINNRLSNQLGWSPVLADSMVTINGL